MNPTDPADRHAMKVLHGLMRHAGEEATQGIYDAIEQMTGQRTCKALNRAQAFEIADRLAAICGQEGVPLQFAAVWCPQWTRGRATLHGGNVKAMPSIHQALALFRYFQGAQIQDPCAFLAARFGLKDGILRTAEDASWICKSLRIQTKRKHGSSRAEDWHKGHHRRGQGRPRATTPGKAASG